MKYRLLYILFVCSGLFACVDDDAPSPSYEDNDWYEIKHDPSADELDQLRYSIYKETDIPIFYTDTLGSEIRYDGGGNPYTYYSVFRIGYIFIASGSNVKYLLSNDRDAILCMTELLRDYTIPLLTDICRPRGFLIVDSLSNTAELTTGVRPRISGYKDMEMTLTGLKPAEETGLPIVTEMTEEQKEIYGYDMAFLDVYAYLSREFASSVERFVAICENTGVKYGSSVDKNINPMEVGFFQYTKIESDNNRIKVITQEVDMKDYMSRIYFKTDAEIRAEIAGYPVMLEKYQIMLDILKKGGFEYLIHKTE